MKEEVYGRMVEMYGSGEHLPWDDELPPPEVMATAAQMEPGRALDLGSGYGRTAIYLARHGWQVEAVEFVEIALAEAQRRAQTADISINFHNRSVTELDFLEPPIDLAVDVGCGHALEAAELVRYYRQLKRLLRPQGVFLLFARIQSPEPIEQEFKGMDERLLRTLFEDGFSLQKVERGTTQTPADKPPWESAWFWFERNED